MEGLTTSELSMIHKLAGNDGLMRKKTMKKLKIWLGAISRKVPDTPECREIVENNFLRVWKALFYCMWMADKPLPQEQLAEQISNLVEIFGSKPHVLNLFVEWFFRSMAREWPHIDRLRLDKFMMLTRRFLRRTFMVISERKWKLDILEGFLKTLTSNVFNRRPETKSTRSKARDPAIEIAPLGMQLHVIDIFLEELAKTGGESLKSQKILKILTPFMHELAYCDDDRLLGDIEEKIFKHLMRQSDPGIDYAEGVQRGEEDEDDDEDEEEEVVAENGASDDEMDDMEPIPLDPRAGKVDVVLPQLSISYSDLSKKLTEVGAQKTVKQKNRRILYGLARKFKEVDAGSYPLAVNIEVLKGPALSRQDIDAAAQRLIELEESMTDHARKNRQPKNIRKKLAKKLKREEAQASLNESSSSEAGNSIYLQDDDLLDHVGDNYMSYLEELHKNGEAKEENGDANNYDDTTEDDENEDVNGVDSTDKSFSMLDIENDQDEGANSPNTGSKGKKKYKTVIEVEADEIDAPTSSAVLNEANQPKINLIKRRSLRPQVEENGVVGRNIAKAAKSPAKRASLMKKKVPDDFDDSDPNSEDGSGDDTVINLSSSKFRKRRLNDTISRGMKPGTPSNVLSPATPGTMSAKRKRVSFVLARNLEHPHADYKESITRSPAVPFDAEKRPNFGLLKTAKSPASPSPSLSMILATTPRRRTNRF